MERTAYPQFARRKRGIGGENSSFILSFRSTITAHLLPPSFFLYFSFSSFALLSRSPPPSPLSKRILSFLLAYYATTTTTTTTTSTTTTSQQPLFCISREERGGHLLLVNSRAAVVPLLSFRRGQREVLSILPRSTGTDQVWILTVEINGPP